MKTNILPYLCLTLICQFPFLSSGAEVHELQFSLSKDIAAQSGQDSLLKKWSLNELKTFKSVSQTEKDPIDGKSAVWKGVPLSVLIEESLKSISAETKAQIDLVVVRGKDGIQAFIPRAFTVKYPILFALSRSGGDLAERGPIYSVIPWTSNAKIKQEAAPLQSFFVSGVAQVEFSNYRKLFGRFFLQKRTDPAAMRGEKLFVQNCITCHGAAQITGQKLWVGKSGDRMVPTLDSIAIPERISRLMKQGHPDVPGVAKLQEKEIRALTSYLDAHRMENGQAPTVSSL